MVDFVDEAMEVPSLIIGDPETGQVGIFAGGVLPNVAAPGAPLNSWFFRNNGEIYTHSGAGDASSDWTKDVLAANDLPGGGGARQHVPICLADGSTLNLIRLVGGYVPVLLADGQTNQIQLS